MTEEQKVEMQKTEKMNMGGDRQFPTFSYFPADKWQEYNIDVERNWSSVRWAKAWHDHEVATRAKKEDAMWAVIMELKQEIAMMKAAPVVEEKRFVKTLGGKIEIGKGE